MQISLVMRLKEDPLQEYIFVLGNSPISWKSITQKNIALSTTEAEYSSLIECTKQAIWIRRLVNEIFNKNIRIILE